MNPHPYSSSSTVCTNVADDDSSSRLESGNAVTHGKSSKEANPSVLATRNAYAAELSAQRFQYRVLASKKRLNDLAFDRFKYKHWLSRITARVTGNARIGF
ncbi:hypothetical protein [Aureliella helgolandensis]|nr:hypothetical protein [Aureliella helgolandensis]